MYLSFLIYLIIAFAALIAYLLKKIDIPGALAGTVLATFVWQAGGHSSLFALFSFFVLGTLATAHGRKKKNAWLVDQPNHGKRGIFNVLGNGGMATIISIEACFITPHPEAQVPVLIISCFAVACSDTFSSELGSLYGKKYINICNLHSAKRGADGAISLAGTMFGLFGSVLIALGMLPFGYRAKTLAVVAIAGLAGNLADSVLGATLQQKKYLNNHGVNFFATFLGCLVAYGLMQLLRA